MRCFNNYMKEGRIVEYEWPPPVVPVSLWNNNAGELINSDAHAADEPREYRNDNGEVIQLNQFNEIIDTLAKHSFC